MINKKQQQKGLKNRPDDRIWFYAKISVQRHNKNCCV